MDQASKRKVELMLPPDEVGEFLRKLGEELQSGELRIGSTSIVLEGFKSVAFSLKPEGGALRVKLKVKFPKPLPPLEFSSSRSDAEGGVAPPETSLAPVDSQDESGAEDVEELDEDFFLPERGEEFLSDAIRPRPKYKSLKKRMKTQFKGLKDAVERGELPPKDLVNAFALASELMISYPDEGEEYYGDYERAMQEFLVACAEKDLERVRQGLTALDDLKHACHARYK